MLSGASLRLWLSSCLETRCLYLCLVLPPPQDLIVDQTIEKVSFCAPDRNFDKAFSYICRDGTTRRWICHCFLALKDSVGGMRVALPGRHSPQLVVCASLPFPYPE